MVDSSQPPADDREAVAWLAQAAAEVRQQVASVVVGQEAAVEQLLTAVLCNGHCLIEGVPGLAKTLLVSTLARTLDMSFKRIQFTPDLMPSDITGTDVMHQEPGGGHSFRFVRGPVFANVILADEINRTPPKTQAALLEAMQEGHVTAGTTTHALDQPFFVLATQNPLDQEGTWPLPEAQLDRFLFKVPVGYPSADEELEIMRRAAGPAGEAAVRRVMGAAQVQALQALVRRMPIGDQVLAYARNLVRATRPADPTAPAAVRTQVAWGAGPRAAIGIAVAAKARAALRGANAVGFEDVAAVAPAVLRHRLACTYAATAAGMDADRIIAGIVETVGRP